MTPASSTASTSTTGMPRARSRAIARARIAERRDQHALDLHPLEELEVPALLRDVIVAVADEDAVARGRRRLLGSAHQCRRRTGLAMLITVMPSSPLRPARSCRAAWSGT